MLNLDEKKLFDKDVNFIAKKYKIDNPTILDFKNVFFEEYNIPWLKEIISRGDDIIIISNVSEELLYNINKYKNSTMNDFLTNNLTYGGFECELFYLYQKGYIYDCGKMVKIK